MDDWTEEHDASDTSMKSLSATEDQPLSNGSTEISTNEALKAARAEKEALVKEMSRMEIVINSSSSGTSDSDDIILEELPTSHQKSTGSIQVPAYDTPRDTFHPQPSTSRQSHYHKEIPESNRNRNTNYGTGNIPSDLALGFEEKSVFSFGLNVPRRTPRSLKGQNKGKEKGQKTQRVIVPSYIWWYTARNIAYVLIVANFLPSYG